MLLNVCQARDANTLEMVRRVRKTFAKHAREWPPDVHIATFYDQSELVSVAASSVRDAILVGAVLAGMVLLVFLRDLRLTLIVAIVLPVVLAITALLLRVLGMSFNIMTLGGMAAAVGLIIDDAIVMIEHSCAGCRSAERRRRASPSLRGGRRVRAAAAGLVRSRRS